MSSETENPLDSVWTIVMGQDFVTPPVADSPNGETTVAMFGSREDAEEYATYFAERRGTPRSLLRIVQFKQAAVFEMEDAA